MPSWVIPTAVAVIVIIAVTIALIVGETKPQTHKNNQVSSACGPYRKDVVIHINGQSFDTEIAKSSTEFAKGLGGRPCILSDQAMLFSFRQPGHYAFWMKDVKFPIDIVWISSDHKVAGVEIDVQPSSYPDKFVNRDNLAQYVMEVKANRAKDLHIDIGTPVQF